MYLFSYSSVEKRRYFKAIHVENITRFPIFSFIFDLAVPAGDSRDPDMSNFLRNTKPSFGPDPRQACGSQQQNSSILFNLKKNIIAIIFFSFVPQKIEKMY